jgi:hypothetical protein
MNFERFKLIFIYVKMQITQDESEQLLTQDYGLRWRVISRMRDR